jgi:hypothetical protein
MRSCGGEYREDCSHWAVIAPGRCSLDSTLSGCILSGDDMHPLTLRFIIAGVVIIVGGIAIAVTGPGSERGRSGKGLW